MRAWYEMYYDDNIDYVYCAVAKVSCTNWKRTLLMLSGKVAEFQRPAQIPWRKSHHDDFIRRHIGILVRVPPEYRNWRFKDNRYFTFLFVREPLERLVSAYRDKVVEQNAATDRKIFRRYGHHVTFAQFVRYVLDEHSSGRVLDRHWIPQSQLCRVCEYRWHFIGHYETMHRDVNYVVSKLKSRIMDSKQRLRVDNIMFPAQPSHRRKSYDFLQQMFATVPAADVDGLYKLYKMDYLLFGYKHPNITGFI